MDIKPSLNVLRNIPLAVDSFNQRNIAELPVIVFQEERNIKMPHPMLRPELELGNVRANLFGVKKLQSFTHLQPFIFPLCEDTTK